MLRSSPDSDLLELVRPTGIVRSLQSPLLLASAIGEQERLLAAQVWDEIVRIEDGRLSDWRLIEKARQFRVQWLGKRREPPRYTRRGHTFEMASSSSDAGNNGSGRVADEADLRI